MRAAIRLGKLTFFIRANRTDHGYTQRACPLTCDQPHTTGGSMKQDRLASFERERAVKQILHRQTLQHHRSSGVETD